MGKSTLLRTLATAKNKLHNAKKESSPNDVDANHSQEEESGTSSDSDAENEDVLRPKVKTTEKDEPVLKPCVEICHLYPSAQSPRIWSHRKARSFFPWRRSMLIETLSRFRENRTGVYGVYSQNPDAERWAILDCSPWTDLLLELEPVFRDPGTAYVEPHDERMEVNEKTKIIIESHDLSQASPNTVCLLPTVFLEGTDEDWQILVSCWLAQIRMSLPAIARVFDDLTHILSLLLPELILWLRRTADSSSLCNEKIVMSNLLSYLSSCLSVFKVASGKALTKRVSKEANQRQSSVSLSLVTELSKPIAASWGLAECQTHLQGLVISACVSVFASHSPDDCEAEIDSIIRKQLSDNTRVDADLHSHSERHKLWMRERRGKIHINLPREEALTSYTYDCEMGGFMKWEEVLQTSNVEFATHFLSQVPDTLHVPSSALMRSISLEHLVAE